MALITKVKKKNGPWRTLAEKRYSYLRDLFNTVREATENGWDSLDYKLADGTFVFYGGPDNIVVIRASDGAIFRGSLINSYISLPGFEDLKWWEEPKRWDIFRPESAPVSCAPLVVDLVKPTVLQVF